MCVGSELVYTVTTFYDVDSTWVDLVKKKTFLTSLKSVVFFFSKPLLIPFVPSLI